MSTAEKGIETHASPASDFISKDGGGRTAQDIKNGGEVHAITIEVPVLSFIAGEVEA